MLCRDIIHRMEQDFPVETAMEWDNVGLIVGRYDKEVKRIYIALDVTDEVLADAVSKKVDLLISHHPLLFSSIKKINDVDFIGNRLITLIQNDISYYAMHTNYDVIRMGELAGNMLGLQELEVFEENGIGKIGCFEQELTLAKCCEKVKDAFHLSGVKVFGNLEKGIRRVAVSPGSGKHMSEIAIEKKADVFITAEIDHHEGIDAVARGVAVVDAGHYGMEHIFIADMKAYMETHFANVEIDAAKISHPFQFV